MRADGQRGWIGFQISKAVPFPGEAIPITISSAPPKLFLHIIQTLELDQDEQQFLLVRSSSYAVCLDSTPDTTILHYDYDRDPGNDYPMAHVQVDGASSSLAELCERTGVHLELGQLHLPVGGKRYRPSVEDLIEMLVVEGFAQARSGWREALDQHRSYYHDLQLRSVVRRDPDTATQALEWLGYTVTPPVKE
jgi:hypothetical protein